MSNSQQIPSSGSDHSNPKKQDSALYRWLRRIVLLSAGLCALCYIFLELALKPYAIKSIKEQAAEVGIIANIEAIRSNYFSYLQLHNINLKSKDQSWSLVSKQLQINFNLGDFFRDKPLFALKKIQLKNIDIILADNASEKKPSKIDFSFLEKEISYQSLIPSELYTILKNDVPHDLEFTSGPLHIQYNQHNSLNGRIEGNLNFFTITLDSLGNQSETSPTSSKLSFEQELKNNENSISLTSKANIILNKIPHHYELNTTLNDKKLSLQLIKNITISKEKKYTKPLLVVDINQNNSLIQLEIPNKELQKILPSEYLGLIPSTSLRISQQHGKSQESNTSKIPWKWNINISHPSYQIIIEGLELGVGEQNQPRCETLNHAELYIQDSIFKNKTLSQFIDVDSLLFHKNGLHGFRASIDHHDNSLHYTVESISTNDIEKRIRLSASFSHSTQYYKEPSKNIFQANYNLQLHNYRDDSNKITVDNALIRGEAVGNIFNLFENIKAFGTLTAHGISIQDTPINSCDIAWKLHNTENNKLALSLNECKAISAEHKLQLNKESTLIFDKDSSWVLTPLHFQSTQGFVQLSGAGQNQELHRAHISGALNLDPLTPLIANILDNPYFGPLPNQNLNFNITFKNKEIQGLASFEDNHYQYQTQLHGSPQETKLRFQQQYITEPENSKLLSEAEISWPLGFSFDSNYFQSLIKTDIHGQIRVDTLRLDLLSELSQDIPRLEGFASLSGQLSGTLIEPNWSLHVEFKDASVSGFGDLPPLKKLRGHVSASPQGLQSFESRGPLQAELGGAPIQLDGFFALPGENRETNIRFQSNRALFVRSADMRLRASSDVQLQGVWPHTNLSGSLKIDELVYAKPMSLTGDGALADQDHLFELFRIDAPPFNRMKLDLRIYGGLKEKEREELRAKNNIISGNISLDLQLKGTGAAPLPNGWLQLENGSLRLPFTTYKVSTARILFPSDRPFDPDLSARANTRLQGYDIDVQASGRVLDPRIEVTTSPPLGREDAFLLASAGRTPQELEDAGMQGAIAATLPYLGRELQRIFFGDAAADDIGSIEDRISISIDEERSSKGLSTMRIEALLKKPMHIYAERDRFEQYNMGFLFRWIPGLPHNDSISQSRKARAHWTVRFAKKGAAGVNSSALTREIHPLSIEYFEENDVGLIEEAEKRLIRYCQDRGYLDCSVQSIIAKNDHKKSIQFIIEQGARWNVHEIRLTGFEHDSLNTWYKQSQDILNQAFSNAPFFTQAKEDGAIQAMIGPLRRAGFANLRYHIQHIKHKNNKLSIIVHCENVIQYLIGPLKLTLHDEQSPLSFELITQLRDILDSRLAEAWQRRELARLRTQLLSVLSNAGYAFATVEISSEIPEKKDLSTEEKSLLQVKLHGDISISCGPQIYIRNLQFVGHKRSKEHFLLQRFQFDTPQLAQENNLQLSQSRLRFGGLFRQVSATLSDPFLEDGIYYSDLKIELEEAAPRRIETHLGYGSYEEFRGGFRYSDMNLFGLGRRLEIDAEVSMKSYGGRGRILDRDILGHGRDLDIAIFGNFREEPSFDRTTLGTDISVRTIRKRQFQTEFAYSLSAERAEDISGGVSGQESADFIIDAQLRASLRWEGRDDALLPKKGSMAQISLGVSDDIIGSQVNYIETGARIGHVQPLYKNKIYGAIQLAGIIRTITDTRETLPIQYRLFLGGATTVRSFEQDELGPVGDGGAPSGGLSSAYSNIELRFKLSTNSHLAMFYDVGEVAEKSWEFLGNIGQAYGLGLRWELPIGPLRVDAGYNPGDRYAANREYAVHLALGFTF